MVNSDNIQLNILKDLIYSIKAELLRPDVDLEQLLPIIIYLDYEALILELIDKNPLLKLKVKDFIIHNLSLIHTKIELSTSLPQHDHQVLMLEEHKIALKQMDFRKMYILIEALEQDWRDTYYPLIEWLSFVLCKIDVDAFLKVLDDKSHIIDIRTMTKKLSNEEKLSIGDISNKLLVKFEIIRSVLSNAEKPTDNSMHKVLAKIVLDFERDLNVWDKLLDYYFEFPSRCPTFFTVLGLILLELSELSLDILVDNLRIHKYNTMESIHAVSSCFTSDNLESRKLSRHIISIYEKWEDFVTKYDTYSNDILTTDVINIVIHYVEKLMSEEEFEIKLSNCVNSISEIENTWFRDTTEESIFFCKHLSLLFVLGYKLEISRKKELLSELKGNHLLNDDSHKIIQINWLNN